MILKTTHQPPSTVVRPVVLWVEDVVTKEYLARIWVEDESLFTFKVAEGNDAVKGAVFDQRMSGYASNVYGLVDRDFGSSNRREWMNNGTFVFRPSSHEIENYMLSWKAMAECRVNSPNHFRSEDDIRARAERHAEKMVFWMACRDVLRRYRELITEDFPRNPRVDQTQSVADAYNHIKSSGWYQSLRDHADRILSDDGLKRDIEENVEERQAQLETGSWIQEFSGKEVFKHLQGYIMQGAKTPSEADVDFAKAIGEWQAANNAAPPELMELKRALLAKVGLKK